jgi:hypothetical protein
MALSRNRPGRANGARGGTGARGRPDALDGRGVPAGEPAMVKGEMATGLESVERPVRDSTAPGSRPEPRVPEPRRVLERAERRRRQGLPALPLLLGGHETSYACARSWAEGQRRRLVLTASPEARGQVLAVVEELFRDGSLAKRLRKRRRRDPGADGLEAGLEMEALLARQRPLDEAPEDAPSPRALASRECLNTLLAREERPSAALICRDLDRALSGLGQPWWRVLQGLEELAEVSDLPGLLLHLDHETASTPLLLNRLAEEHLEVQRTMPGLWVGWSTTSAEMIAFLRTPPDTRAKSILREGVIRLRPGRERRAPSVRLEDHAGRFDALPQGPEPAAPPPELAVASQLATLFSEAITCTYEEAVDRISELEGDRELTRAFGRACLAHHGLDPEGDEVQAARDLLRALLDRMPETEGLFKNGPELMLDDGDVCDVALFSPRRRVAVLLALAPEADEAAWRRVRERDLRLQRAGWVTVRLLAKEVTTRLNSTLDLLRDLAIQSPRTRTEDLR